MTTSHMRPRRLDRERAASIADEGGVSAARFESRPGPDETKTQDDRLRLLAALIVLRCS